MLGKLKARTEGSVKSQINLQKLILPSEFHPNGRIQLDEKTRMPKMPKRTVAYKDVVKRTGKEREVNGGHALAEDSVWRTGLGGPARYFYKLMRDQLHFKMKGVRITTAPDLGEDEAKESRQFVTFALTTKALPSDFLNKKYATDIKHRGMFSDLDKKFYAWMEEHKDAELSKVTDIFAFLPA